MRNEVCAFCGRSFPPQLPYWDYQGLYLCASCIETVVPLVDWPVDQPAKVGGIRLIDLLDSVCTFCHVASRTARLIAGTNAQGQQTRICGSCVQRAQQTVPSWIYANPFPEGAPWQKRLAADPSIQSEVHTSATEVIGDSIWQQIWQQSWMTPKEYDIASTLYWAYYEFVGETYSLPAFRLELRRLTLCVWEHMQTTKGE
jgi:hypothetical protein